MFIIVVGYGVSCSPRLVYNEGYDRLWLHKAKDVTLLHHVCR